MKAAYFGLGLFLTGLGILGAFLPVLPSTPFFTQRPTSSPGAPPRLEAWLLSLPGVGPLIGDYRKRRGVPRRTKRFATLLAIVVGLFSVCDLPHPAGQVATAALIGYGVYFLWKRVPTADGNSRRSSGGSGRDSG